MATLKVLLKQYNPVNGVEANQKRIRKTLDEDFDLAIFPELFYSGYLIRDNLAMSYLDPGFAGKIKDEIGERMIIFGAPFMEGFLYNSAIAITKEETMVYNKRHLPNFGPFEELRYFRRGNGPLTVNFKGFKIGIEICYDLFFDDSVEKGIDLLVNISASPFTSYPLFESVFASRAIENQSYLVYVNNVGLQRNQVFWGGSRVINSDGKDVLQLPKFAEGSGAAMIDSDILELSRRKRRVLSEVLDDSEE